MLTIVCGIGGIVGARADPNALAAMAAAMAHRGPDGQGTWADGEIGLAFRRLAIIDLDTRSNQPMHLDHLHMVFNGEIYNYVELRAELRRAGHRFETEGDGEVLLHAWMEWGEGALERVNGMFALAMWDAQTGTLTLASDPFGEKPLYWTTAGGCLTFASDTRAIFAADAAPFVPDESALALFVALGLPPPIERSYFSGIARLPGAHVLRWRKGAIEIARYWWPRDLEPPATYEQGVGRLRELLTDSIRLRLRADVPIGTSLSGGIDSSAVVALSATLAGEHTRHAFTASFPGFARDEWGLAQDIASVAEVAEHHRVRPQLGELLEDMDRLVMDQEEPFGSTSIYAQWRVMAAAREAGVTVLLDGQGADELFGGYDVSGGWALQSLGVAATMRGLLAGPARLERAKALGYERLPGVLARRYRQAAASRYASREAVALAVCAEPPRIDEPRPMRRELLRESFHTSLPSLLRFADRDSMAHSREVRLPFLDRRVAEFALSLPAGFLYRGGVTKSVLRDAVGDLVPASVLRRREKIRFETPERSWYAQPAFRERAREVLLDPSVSGCGLYDARAIDRDTRPGAAQDVQGLWRALNVELWRTGFSRLDNRIEVLAI
jgi:asparagine synthase (glutamine-hydrolysing)